MDCLDGLILTYYLVVVATAVAAAADSCQNYSFDFAANYYWGINLTFLFIIIIS
jgi:hypothetical protein